MHALTGFQLVEDMLKGYLDSYFLTVRTLLSGRVEFGFTRQDYEDAPMGRLLQVFSKVCSNKELIKDLHKAKRDRDHLAHKALLKLYEIPQPSDQEYRVLIAEVAKMMDAPGDLMTRIVAEIETLKVSLRAG